MRNNFNVVTSLKIFQNTWNFYIFLNICIMQVCYVSTKFSKNLKIWKIWEILFYQNFKFEFKDSKPTQTWKQIFLCSTVCVLTLNLNNKITFESEIGNSFCLKVSVLNFFKLNKGPELGPVFFMFRALVIHKKWFERLRVSFSSYLFFFFFKLRFRCRTRFSFLS